VHGIKDAKRLPIFTNRMAVTTTVQPVVISSDAFCGICAEKIKSSKLIACINSVCKLEACSPCWTRWFTDAAMIREHCMSPTCKTPFNRSVVMNMVGKSRYNVEYRKHKEDMLYAVEKARLPMIQRRAQMLVIRRGLSEFSDAESEAIKTGVAHRSALKLSVSCMMTRLENGEPVDEDTMDDIVEAVKALGKERTLSNSIIDIDAIKASIVEDELKARSARSALSKRRREEAEEAEQKRSGEVYDAAKSAAENAQPSVAAENAQPAVAGVQNMPAAAEPDVEAARIPDAAPAEAAPVPPAKKAKRSAPFHCPALECNGYVVGRGASAACGICGIRVCLRCEAALPAIVLPLPAPPPVDADAPVDASPPPAPEVHVCKPEDVESVREKLHSSRPCPTCHVPVFRISGCSQMFCTACNTPWDWNTEEALPVRAPIHNPHYSDYLTQQRRQREQAEEAREATASLPLQEDACMADVTQRFIVNRRGLEAADRALLTVAYRTSAHLADRANMGFGKALYAPTDDELRRARRKAMDKCGCDFLLALSDEARYKRDLQEMHKKTEKQDELMRIREDLFDLVRDVIGRVNASNATEVIANLEQLREATNAALHGVQETFNCMVPEIGFGWVLEKTTGR
jgi:hypothetical protein